MLALGLMSGTSLDGIDLALCRFHKKDTRWSFEIIAADTVSYDAEWTEKLGNSAVTQRIRAIYSKNH